MHDLAQIIIDLARPFETPFKLKRHLSCTEFDNSVFCLWL